MEKTIESPIHSIVSLFDQLGLDSTDQAIADFIHRNGCLSHTLKLYQADFWSPAQASFIVQAKDEDADWAQIVDQLDAMLR